MTVRIGINGFGRIGRQVARIVASGGADVELAAINTTRSDPRLLAHLMKYDSVHGRYDGEVKADNDRLFVGGNQVRVSSHAEPEGIDWASCEVDVVLEASGWFLSGDEARGHLAGGAERVLITAPATGEDVTLVLGANEETFDPARHHVISGASCTTACLAPVARVLHEGFGIAGGFVTTVHAFTRDQELVDGSHDDFRRARSAALNIVPTRTGAAKTLARVLPELEGRLGAMAVRVPAADVSLLAINVSLDRSGDPGEVNEVFREAASSPRLAGILGVTNEPLVSSDFIGDPRSAVVDLGMTRTEPGNHTQVLAWYDNEFGYASRMVDLVRLIGEPDRLSLAGPRVSDSV
jgi:glyceraldehyde 3-phosphate dehydrogenase